MAAFWRHGITEFAASFSNAGGFGIISALNYNIQNFKNENDDIKIQNIIQIKSEKIITVTTTVFKNDLRRII